LFENRTLRRINGPKEDQRIRSRRNLHYKERHKLHYAPHIIRMITSRRIRLAGHVAGMGRGGEGGGVGEEECV
jgi:hypothetical protein